MRLTVERPALAERGAVGGGCGRSVWLAKVEEEICGATHLGATVAVDSLEDVVMGRDPEISPQRKKQFSLIELSRERLLEHAEQEGLPLHRVEFVVPFGNEDFDLEVWLFYEKNRDVRRLKRAGTLDALQRHFITILRDLDYPQEWLASVRFQTDSHQNVERNYEGSYFKRMR